MLRSVGPVSVASDLMSDIEDERMGAKARAHREVQMQAGLEQERLKQEEEGLEEQQQRVEAEKQRIDGVARHREACKPMAMLNKQKDGSEELERLQQERDRQEQEKCSEQELAKALRLEAVERHRVFAVAIKRLNAASDTTAAAVGTTAHGRASNSRGSKPPSGPRKDPEAWHRLSARNAQAGRSLTHAMPHFTLAHTKHVM
jgi:hypothetical protein